MNVQMIDREPKGTDTRFAGRSTKPIFGVSSGAFILIADPGSYAVSDTAVSIVFGSQDVQWFDAVGRIVPSLTFRSLSATKRQLDTDDVEQEFMTLASRWRSETGMLSSPTDQASHPDYLRIIGMGREVLPFILRELRDRGEHWFYALEAITGANPIPSDAEGYVGKMKDAWLGWGRKEGLI